MHLKLLVVILVPTPHGKALFELSTRFKPKENIQIASDRLFCVQSQTADRRAQSRNSEETLQRAYGEVVLCTLGRERNVHDGV